MKKIVSLLLAFVLALSLAACAATQTKPYESVNIRLGGLKGPTSMGMAKLLDDAENGLTGTGIKALAEACGCTPGNLYAYFKNLDDLIIESTAYCMSKVEDEFMAKAPTDPADIQRFIAEVPYWTAERHGKKYRLMYQVYTLPKYIEHGKKFFEGVNERYTEYAKRLEERIGIPHTIITPLIFIFVRACVHFAMFGDEYYLKSQMGVLKQGVDLFLKKYNGG